MIDKSYNNDDWINLLEFGFEILNRSSIDINKSATDKPEFIQLEEVANSDVDSLFFETQ